MYREYFLIVFIVYIYIYFLILYYNIMNGTDLIRIKIFKEVVRRLNDENTCEFGATPPPKGDYSKMYIKYNEKYYCFTDPPSENSYRAIYESINPKLSDEEYLRIIKEWSYTLAIHSPVNIESKKSLYLDIYNDVKKEKEKVEEEAKKVVEEEKVEEVYDEGKAAQILNNVDEIEEHGEIAQLIIKNALKNFLNVAEILKKCNLKMSKNVNILYGIITYNNIEYKIDGRDLTSYEEIVQLLNTTKDYLDSGQTLGKQDAVTITQQVRTLKTISKSTILVGLYDAVLADVIKRKSTGGGKRKSKGKSNKVAKKPAVSQKKQSIYKEIFGKQMKIYKMPDSRKEYVKYKGELHPISEYKSLMKQKALAKPKPKPKPRNKI